MNSKFQSHSFNNGWLWFLGCTSVAELCPRSDQYSKLRPENYNHNNPETQLNISNPDFFQRKADYYRVAFRVNGVTYYHHED
jgi:hypothetical protein